MPTKTTKPAFSRGPYGEILPPPLMNGLTPADLNDVVREMIDDPALTEGEDLTPYHPNAMVYVLQQNLVRALSGELNGPDAADLRAAVLRGEPLSVRPVGHETLAYRTFAPVLQRISDTSWRLGLEKHGQTAIIAGDNAGIALRLARQIYVTWAEAEAAAVPA
jgi:hypothetical protein